jgi:hypothetical protein
MPSLLVLGSTFWRLRLLVLRSTFCLGIPHPGTQAPKNPPPSLFELRGIRRSLGEGGKNLSTNIVSAN